MSSAPASSVLKETGGKKIALYNIIAPVRFKAQRNTLFGQCLYIAVNGTHTNFKPVGYGFGTYVLFRLQ